MRALVRQCIVATACLLAVAAPRSAVALAPPTDESKAAKVGPSRVLVLPVRLAGELPPGTDDEVRSVLRANLLEDTIELLPDEEPRLSAECDETCRRTAAQARDADFLLQADITGAEDEFNVTVTLFDGATGKELVPFTDACSICGFVEVRDMVRLRTLDARAEIVRRRRAAVAAAAAPPPPVCETQEPVIKEVEVPGTCPAPPPARRSAWISAGWGLIGTGAAAAAGGGVILALHHRDAGCQADPRTGGCIPLRYTTLVPGATILGLGIATTLGGALAVVLGRRSDRRKADASVAIGPRGARLSVRF